MKANFIFLNKKKKKKRRETFFKTYQNNYKKKSIYMLHINIHNEVYRSLEFGCVKVSVTFFSTTLITNDSVSPVRLKRKQNISSIRNKSIIITMISIVQRI